MDDIRFKIAEAARMAGVSPSTLRLWETQDLIQPIRTPSGQRLYDRALVERLKTIAWLRSEKGLNPAAIRESLRDEAIGEDGSAFDFQNEDGSEPTEIPVGLKIRRLRRDAGKTLEAVAQATGVSVSQLSTFERTSQGLSFTALHGVARVLGTTLASLSGQELREGGESIIRDGKWPTWPTTSSGVTVQVLAEGRNQMECNRFQLAPGASSEGAYQHDGEEFIHVLSGSLEIILDGDRFFELHAGDSFYFESRRPHSWHNRFDGETVLLWINTPATF
ncbi:MULTISPECIES: MerR family transcriptional regulator [Alphaproteobacteria]|uniref:LacI family transcriptional regulator n=2 Tax=Alphaproteobacteria TaxID=28211 RepID=A0A512HN69_9HYPH|nr:MULTISPECIES: MerR family transcriptional regulator [Alphaproteobacteria]GEO86896.1 LacI family transcriptional regulator [Ciceribacter naphthalenivorans]GLR22210.1 LacI family transcriptional regulator [Ciceribacter naphthalenivorans]GLT05066.1 LacI family transcriptional regulator [Sphingomonas psychrolutea]